MAWFFNRKEKRSNETPHIETTASVCDTVNEGVALLNSFARLRAADPMKQSPFFAAVSLISNSIASMSWKVKSKNDNVDALEDFYVDHLFDYMNVKHFIAVKNMISDVILHGNGYAYIHRDKNGNPKSLEYLAYGKCSPIYNDITGVLVYQIPTISVKNIEPINVLHFKMLTYDGIIGIPLVDFAINTIKLSGASEANAQAYFKEGGMLRGYISSTAPKLTPEQKNQIKDGWIKSLSGEGTPVLPADCKFNPIVSNNREAQLLETRLFNVQEVARWFQMSPVMLGDLSKTSYNSIEQSQLQFVLNTLRPYVEMMETELNGKLISVTDRNNYYIDVQEEDIIKGDKQSQVNYLTTLCEKGILTVNEVRESLGYGPVEGGDKLTVAYTKVDDNIISDTSNSNSENQTEENSGD